MRKSSAIEQPLDPRLPGRYGRMTRAELDAEVEAIEKENPQGTPLTDAEWAAMKRAALAERRRRGRPAKAEADKVARVLVTMPRDLLAAVDAAAAARDVSRAALIADGMRRLLKIKA